MQKALQTTSPYITKRSFKNIFVHVYVHMCIHVYPLLWGTVSLHATVGQRAILWSWFSSSTFTWVQGLKSGLQVCVASASICWVVLLMLKDHFLKRCKIRDWTDGSAGKSIHGVSTRTGVWILSSHVKSGNGCTCACYLRAGRGRQGETLLQGNRQRVTEQDTEHLPLAFDVQMVTGDTKLRQGIQQ